MGIGDLFVCVVFFFFVNVRATTVIYIFSVHDALPIYSAADVHVSLSREDVGPMTVVESLLCGTPVVGFSIGVLPEVVIQHHTGMAVEPYNVDEIVKGIEYFLSDGLDVAQTAELCRQTAVRYGDPVASANRHKKLYESLIQKHISMANGTQK